MSKVFVDTNILVYSMDKHDLHKMKKSRSILKKLKKEMHGVISTQVLQEFYVVATKKLKADPINVKDIIRSFENFEIVTITPAIINDAIDCSILNVISFWDSLIVSAAEYAKCAQLWTEDLNTGQVIRGVKIVNPFNTT
jgi:predicted nucleic acid-binding protein